jgi:hypothetical protein
MTPRSDRLVFLVVDKLISADAARRGGGAILPARAGAVQCRTTIGILLRWRRAVGRLGSQLSRAGTSSESRGDRRRDLHHFWCRLRWRDTRGLPYGLLEGERRLPERRHAYRSRHFWGADHPLHLLLAFVSSPVAAVALLSSTLFFLRWAGLYWSIPATLTDRGRAGVLGGMMNFAGNVGGILVPIIVGVIVQVTGSYFLALMFFSRSQGVYHRQHGSGAIRCVASTPSITPAHIYVTTRF